MGHSRIAFQYQQVRLKLVFAELREYAKPFGFQYQQVRLKLDIKSRQEDYSTDFQYQQVRLKRGLMAYFWSSPGLLSIPTGPIKAR